MFCVKTVGDTGIEPVTSTMSVVFYHAVQFQVAAAARRSVLKTKDGVSTRFRCGREGRYG